MELDALLTALAEGDKSAFEKMYHGTYRTVFYIALSVVKDRALAEDVSQNVYLNVVRKVTTYRKGSNPAAWIARIARNEAIDLRRKRMREECIDEQESPTRFGTVETDDYGLLIDLAKRILPDDEFSILMLVTAEGYKRREIAGMLKIPLPTVTWKYNRAIRAMQKALKDTEGEGGGR